jgi:hypothetical protein
VGLPNKQLIGMELWKSVSRWDDLYEVSSEGRVRRNGRVLKPSTLRTGYVQATASLHTRVIKYALVHRLVAEAFIGPIPDGMQVNHKNGIRSDNRVENLEIVSASENNLHAYRTLGRERPQGSKHPAARLTETNVLEIRARYEAGERQSDLARAYTLDPTSIRDIVHRYRWTHI